MEENYIIFTLVLEPSGKLTNVTNVAKEQLPMLYKALRVIENQIFDDIANKPLEVPDATPEM